MPCMSSGPDPRHDRPIFVLGCPRSGTTLLQLMLHSHARIAIPAETKFVIPAYARRCEFGDLEVRENRRALAEWITGERSTKFRVLGLDADAVVEEIVDGPPTVGSAIGIVFRAYARRFGKVRWATSAQLLRQAGTLLRMFPDAQFVHLVRDGRDCVASLMEMPWYDKDVYHAISAWRESIDRGRRLAERLGPDSYYELQYERLVADPADELARLCGFLGEDFDPAMTRPEGIARQTVSPSKKWHRRTRDGVTTSRIGSWAERLDAWQISLAEAAFGERLAEYGYEPSGLPKPPASQLARFTKTSAHRRIAQRKAALRERWKQHHEPNPVRCLLPPASTPSLTEATPTAQTEQAQKEQARAGSAGPDAKRAVPAQAGPERPRPEPAGPEPAGSERAGSERAEPERAESERAKAAPASTRPGTNQVGACGLGVPEEDADAHGRGTDRNGACGIRGAGAHGFRARRLRASDVGGVGPGRLAVQGG